MGENKPAKSLVGRNGKKDLKEGVTVNRAQGTVGLPNNGTQVTVGSPRIVTRNKKRKSASKVLSKGQGSISGFVSSERRSAVTGNREGGYSYSSSKGDNV